MRVLRFLFVVVALAGVLCGCKKENNVNNMPTVNVGNTQEAEGDSTVYGLCVDAASNSVQILTNNGDTVEYIFDNPNGENVELGGKFPGDRLAIIGYEGKDENLAQKVINITSLQGRWTSLDKDFEILDGGVVESSVQSESNPYTSWKIYNGKLILSKDTFDIGLLGPDSLLLENANGIFAFKRKTN